MKKMYIVLLAFVGLVNGVSAQAPNWQWANTSGGVPDDEGSSVVTDASGNVYVAGSLGSASATYGSITITNTPGFGGVGTDVIVVKYDPLGNAIWAKNFGGTATTAGNGSAKGIDIDASGNVYITGIFFGTGMTFGSTTLSNSDTNYSSAGEIFIAKLDGSGNVVWAKSAGGATNDGAAAISVDGSGNAYITGYYTSSSITFGSTTLTTTNNAPVAGFLIHWDIFIVKYNSSGSVVWAKTEGTVNNETANSIAADASGNIVLAGSFYIPSVTFGSITLTATAATNLFIVKYDASGTALWAQTATATGSGAINHSANDVSLDASGNAYITGTFIANTLTFGSITLNKIGGNDFFVVKYDSTGNPIWASNGGATTATGTALDVDASGNVFVTGYFDGYYLYAGSDSIANANTGGNNTDVFLTKCNSSGVFQWVKGAGGNYQEIPNGLSVDPSSNVLITGKYTSATVAFGTIIITNAQVSYNDMFVAKLGNVTGIEENTFDNSISAFPNPNNGVFFVKSEIIISQLEVVNMLGEVIYSEKLNATETQLDLSNQPKGIYFVKVVDENKQIANKKIVVQ